MKRQKYPNILLWKGLFFSVVNNIFNLVISKINFKVTIFCVQSKFSNIESYDGIVFLKGGRNKEAIKM